VLGQYALTLGHGRPGRDMQDYDTMAHDIQVHDTPVRDSWRYKTPSFPLFLISALSSPPFLSNFRTLYGIVI